MLTSRRAAGLLVHLFVSTLDLQVIVAGPCRLQGGGLFNWKVASRVVSCDHCSISVAENTENTTVCLLLACAGRENTKAVFKINRSNE